MKGEIPAIVSKKIEYIGVKSDPYYSAYLRNKKRPQEILAAMYCGVIEFIYHRLELNHKQYLLVLIFSLFRLFALLALV